MYWDHSFFHTFSAPLKFNKHNSKIGEVLDCGGTTVPIGSLTKKKVGVNPSEVYVAPVE